MYPFAPVTKHNGAIVKVGNAVVIPIGPLSKTATADYAPSLIGRLVSSACCTMDVGICGTQVGFTAMIRNSTSATAIMSPFKTRNSAHGLALAHFPSPSTSALGTGTLV